MTVYESIAGWLNEILTNPANELPTIGAVIIDIEQIPEHPEDSNAALFSSPNDDHSPLMAGRAKHTVFRSFYFRRDFGSREEREANEGFFEKLHECIDERNINGDFPKGDGRQWISIEVNGGIFPDLRPGNNLTADYLIPLKICYIQ